MNARKRPPSRASRYAAEVRAARRMAGTCTECHRRPCVRVILDGDGTPIAWSTMTRCAVHRIPGGRETTRQDPQP